MTAGAALPSFDRLVETCRRLGLNVVLAPPDPAGHGVADPQLAALVARANGARLDDVRLYGGPGAADDLVEATAATRRIRDDLPFLERLTLFAKIGRTSHHLAVANSAGPSGQVAFVDLSEEPRVLPVASSVDAALALLAAWLELREAADEGFPWDVAALVARDDAVLAAADEWAQYPAATGWLDQVRRNGGEPRDAV